MKMTDKADPASESEPVDSAKTRLKWRAEQRERTKRALEELKDPALNPFRKLGELFREASLSGLSPEKAKEKEARRKERLAITLAALKRIEAESGKKMKSSAEKHKPKGGNLPPRQRKQKKVVAFQDEKLDEPELTTDESSDVDEEESSQEFEVTAKSNRRRRHYRRR